MPTTKHELINVTSDQSGWTGECRCRGWVTAMCSTKASVKRQFRGHLRFVKSQEK